MVSVLSQGDYHGGSPSTQMKNVLEVMEDQLRGNEALADLTDRQERQRADTQNGHDEPGD
jgi:hypothetical protein